MFKAYFEAASGKKPATATHIPAGASRYSGFEKVAAASHAGYQPRDAGIFATPSRGAVSKEAIQGLISDTKSLSLELEEEVKAPSHSEMSGILKREAPAYGKENHYAAPVQRNPIMMAYDAPGQTSHSRPETAPMTAIDKQIMEKERELADLESKMSVQEDKLSTYSRPGTYGLSHSMQPSTLAPSHVPNQATATNLRKQQFHSSTPWATSM